MHSTPDDIRTCTIIENYWLVVCGDLQMTKELHVGITIHVKFVVNVALLLVVVLLLKVSTHIGIM